MPHESRESGSASCEYCPWLLSCPCFKPDGCVVLTSFVLRSVWLAVSAGSVVSSDGCAEWPKILIMMVQLMRLVFLSVEMLRIFSRS